MIVSNISTKTASAASTRGKILGPRHILIVVAVLEVLTALWEMLFGRMSILFRDQPDLAVPGFDSFLTKAYLVCHPLLALAGLLLVITGRVRYSIFALGAVVMMRWLNYMPSVALNGLKLNDGFDIQWTAAQIFAFPLMAACGLVLAARDRQLGLATVLISVPTLYNISGFTVLMVRVFVNGV